MKRAYCLLTLALSILIIGMAGCVNLQKDRDVIFQTSMISALSQGLYDGDMTFKELKRYGDFGIGTFNGLDGEMVAIEGEFYQIKADGKAYPVGDSVMTPFSIVTFFEVDKAVLMDEPLDYEQLIHGLDNLLPTDNIFYAIKIEGVFKYIEVRSILAQSKPYPSLVEALKEETIFEFQDVVGTIAGFWCPAYVEGINVPGYHFHFITADKKAGGHLLECQIQNVKVEIDYTSGFYMTLPGSDEFYRLEFGEQGS